MERVFLHQCSPSFFENRSVSVISNLMGFFIPLVIMTVQYKRLYGLLKTRDRKVLSGPVLVSFEKLGGGWGGGGGQDRSKRKADQISSGKPFQ